jgi:hypothetical protein
MYTTLRQNNRVRVNTTIPKELETQWRQFIVDKYGLYRKGMMSQVLEESLKQYMENAGSK